jgi:hypothetical protein
MPSYTAEERAWLQGLIEKEPLRFPSYGKWLGWREHQGEVVDYAFAESTDEIAFTNPDTAVCIEKWTKRSLGPLEVRLDANGQSVFLRGGEPVAMTGCVRVASGVSLRNVDVAEARRVLRGEEGGQSA